MYRTQDYAADWTPAERAEYGQPAPALESRMQPPFVRALVRETLTTMEDDGIPDDEIRSALARHADDASPAQASAADG